MNWKSLKLWADVEEPRIQQCIIAALRRLIDSGHVTPDDDELTISGKLRRFLYKERKHMRLAWIICPEASSFADSSAPRPIGHPDIRFSYSTPDHDQYDYDVECKLVRGRRNGRSHDYCKHYVTDGVQRYQRGTYAQSNPPMGTMVGYHQEGDLQAHLTAINREIGMQQSMSQIEADGETDHLDISRLTQSLRRGIEDIRLTHLWADVRGAGDERCA